MKRVAIVMMLAASHTAFGQTASEDGWQGKIGLGADISSGNSEVTALTLDLSGGYTLGANIYSFEATYGYAETDQELSRQNSRASLKYDRKLTDLTYVYVRAENEYDKIALIDYRYTAGPGAGAFLMKSDRVSLKCDAGVSYIDQKLRDEGLENNLDGVLALRVTERLDVKLSDTASVWQTAEYLPDTDDFDAYLLNAEVGLETRITGTTSLRMVASNRRNSKPPEGVEKDDLSVKASLAFAFGK